MRTAIFLVTVVALSTVAATDLHAQSRQRTARFQPSRPTVSPYLNLTRGDQGGLNNYFSLVRPARQLQQANLRQQQTIQRLRNDVLRFSAPPTGTQSRFMVMGTRSGFQQYSHYFPQPRLRRRR